MDHSGSRHGRLPDSFFEVLGTWEDDREPEEILRDIRGFNVGAGLAPARAGANAAEPRRQRIRLDGPVYSIQGQVFSVTIGTSPRAPIFVEQDFNLECVQILSDLQQETGNSVYAFCLMPDHVHLLLEATAACPLPVFVGRWKSRCYRARRQRGNPRAFWQRSFFDRAVRAGEDLREVALYILNNPVRKGLVEDFRAYPLCGSLRWEI